MQPWTGVGLQLVLLCLLEPRGSRETMSFSLCLPDSSTCRSYTGAQHYEDRCQGPEMSGLNVEKAPWCLPILSPPLAEQGHVLTGTGIHQCTCAQMERCRGWHGSRRGTWAPRDCVRPVPPHADRMACPCELKPAPLPVTLGRLNHLLRLTSHLPLEFPHPAPGLPRKRKQGTGDTPGSGAVREGSSCPGWRR